MIDRKARGKKQAGTPNSCPPKATRLIRYPEPEESRLFRIDLHSIADDIGGKYPMPRVLFGIRITHRINTARLRTVSVKRKSRIGSTGLFLGGGSGVKLFYV